MRVTVFQFIFLLVITMFGASRAFSLAVTRGRPLTQRVVLPTNARQFLVAQQMSSGGGDGPDTSIVDICTQKIQTALEPDNVQVTGMYHTALYSFVMRILNGKTYFCIDLNMLYSFLSFLIFFLFL